MALKHDNSGSCPMCLSIIDRYPNFSPILKAWFLDFQSRHPEAHVSCGGRGRADQEELFIRHATKAHYGESAHNYNCALDLFEMYGDIKNIYEPKWFNEVLAPEIPDWITWYGKPGSSFFELPHIEVKNWRQLIYEGQLWLVEK